MKIFTGDSNIIKEEMEEILNLLPYSYNPAKISNYIATLTELIDAYRLLGHDSTDYINKMDKKVIRNLLAIGYTKGLEKKEITSLIKNERLHNELENQFFSPDEEVLVEDIELPEGIKLDEKQKYEIFMDFLKENHPSCKSIFEWLIQEKRIYEIDKTSLKNETEETASTSAITIYNLNKKNFHILVSKCNSDILQLSALSHENGHVIDGVHGISTKGIKDMNHYLYKNHFIEVISSIYEKDFLDFAIRNNIDKNLSLDALQSYYLDIFYHFDEMNLIHHLPKNIIINGNYKKITKKKLYELVNKKGEVLVDFDELPAPSELDYSFNISYGYGKALATYFTNLRKNNKNKFETVFSKFLDLRMDYFSEDFYNKLGISAEEVGNSIKNEIESSDVKIYTKKVSN